MALAASQNGWPADPDPAVIGIAPCSISGVSIGDGLAGGPSAVVLLYVANQFHRRVEPLVAGTCWGYKYRPVTGGTELSNHASGTAVDFNAPKHPLGRPGTFTTAQVAEIHRILTEVEGTVRWGGDYTGRVDEMHFEITADRTTVTALASRLGAPMQILDYSSGYPGAAAVAAAHYGGAARYLPKEGGSVVKPLTPVELRDYHDHGLAIVLIGEHRDPARPLQGAAAGAHDAAYFLAQAQAIYTAAKVPLTEIPAIYLACDTDTTTATRSGHPGAGDYFQAAQGVLGDLTGCYGEYDLIEYLVQRGLGHWFWQTYAWSIGHNHDNEPRHPNAHLFQRLGEHLVGGVGCDVNDVLKPDFGATIQKQQETDMTPEQDRMLYNLDRLLTALLTGADEVTQVRSLVSDGKGGLKESVLPYPLKVVQDVEAVQADVAAIKTQVAAIAAHVLGNPI